MATKLFPTLNNSDWSSGNNDAKLDGTASGWTNLLLSTAAGSSDTLLSVPTVAGPTNGVEIQSASIPQAWVSDPLDADVTISGSITWNLWASETNMSANAAVNGRLEVIDGATGAITLIDQTARTVEVNITTATVNNFSETPAAGVACKRGDRLRVRIFADDAGTMNSGFSMGLQFNGPTASAQGDSWLQLTENLTFVSEPAGSQIFLTDTASAVATASVDREAWTSRGAGVQTDVVNTAAGWTSPIQLTDTAGGTVVDWFTKPLTAMTLGGAVRCNIRARESISTANAQVGVEVARVNGDGTSASVWGITRKSLELNGGAETVESFLVAGDDLAISDGQRIRIRLFIDDTAFSAMASGATCTVWYAGTSGGASGDTYLTFTQTLTEFVAAQSLLPPNRGFKHLIRR